MSTAPHAPHMAAPDGWWQNGSTSSIERAEKDAHARGLVCPITAELYRDPVLCVGDGYTFERAAVEKWFADGHTTSPMSGVELGTNRRLIPNFNVRQRADQLRGGAPVGLNRPNDTSREEELSPEIKSVPSAPPMPSKSTGTVAGPSQPGTRQGGTGDFHHDPGKLTIHEARYGWAQDLWGCTTSPNPNHGAGAKDVTEIVRGFARNDRLNINPHCTPQYMNKTFWPETASGPAIPRRLGVRYSFGPSGPVREVATLAKPHETVALTVTLASKHPPPATQTMRRDDPTAALPPTTLSTEDLKGCWQCVCWPIFSACEYKRPDGRDTLWHEGCLFPLLVGYKEAWDRVAPDSNAFRKRGKDDVINYNPACPGCFCFGMGCSWRWCKC